MTQISVDVRHPHASGVAQRRRGGAWRLIGRISLALSAVAAALTMSAGPAQAGTADRDGLLQNWATGGCLDSNQTGQVYSNPCQRGNGFQTWQIRGPIGRASDGYEQVTIQNQATGRCLSMFFNLDGNANNLETSPCRDSNGTQFPDKRIDAVGPDWGNVHLRNTQSRNPICLDSARINSAYPNGCNYGTFQTWRLI